MVLCSFPVAAGKMTTTGRLKTTEICSFTVLETRSLKSVALRGTQGVGKVLLPPEALGRICSLPLLASGGLRHCLAEATEIFINHIEGGWRERMQNFKIEVCR